MKNLTLILLLLSVNVYSQITLDFQKPMSDLINVRLSNTETKYVESNFNTIASTNQFSLYNPDGSFFKTIQMPLKPDPSARIYELNYLSKSLFDKDSSTIEYLVCYQWDSISSGTYSGTYYRVEVIREDGTILLNEMNAIPFILWKSSVYNSESGPKLFLNYTYANGYFYQTKVFNLPGEIPSGIQSNPQERNITFSIYPNPNNGSFIIDLHSTNENKHIIDLYSTNGKLIETYQSSSNLMHINNLRLPDGLYLLNSRSNSLNSTTKMIIQK